MIFDNKKESLAIKILVIVCVECVADGRFVGGVAMGLNQSKIMRVTASRATYQTMDESKRLSSSDTIDVNIELKLYEHLGEGHFSSVSKAYVREQSQVEGFMIALKRTSYRNASARVLDREVAILRSMRHVNIIRLYYFFVYGSRESDHRELCLVLEFLPTTLASHLKYAQRTNSSLDPLEVKLWSYQLMRGVNYMHSVDICHRDLKPPNLLVRRETGLLKVADFGSAKRLDAQYNVTYIVSRWYRAPELVLKTKKYSKKIDLWSVGCVIAEMLRTKVLFPASSDNQQLILFTRLLGTPTLLQILAINPSISFRPTRGYNKKPWSELLPTSTPASAGHVLDGLLQWVPDDRITLDRLMTFPFFNGIRGNKNLRLPNGNLVDKSIFAESSTASTSIASTSARPRY